MEKKIRNFIVKTRLKAVLFLAGIFLLVLVVKKAGFREFMDIISGMKPMYLLLAIIASILMLCVGAYRLKKLLDMDIGFGGVFKIYIYGYLLNYASFIQGFGAGAKIGMLKMKKVSLPKSSASVSSEILYDVIFTFIAAAVFFFYNVKAIIKQLKPILNYELMAAGAIVIIAVLAALFRLRKNRHVKEFMMHMFERFSIKSFLYFMPVTFVIWLLSAIAVLFIFMAAGSQISLWIIFGAICNAFILGLVTFIPGGIGVRDVITAYIYSLSGLSFSITGSISVFNRLFTFILAAMIAGLIKAYEFLKGKRP